MLCDILPEIFQNLLQSFLLGGARVVAKFHEDTAVLVMRLHRLQLESVCLHRLEESGHPAEQSFFSEETNVVAETGQGQKEL